MPKKQTKASARTTRTRAKRTPSKATKAKSNSLLSRLLANKSALLIIVGVALVGVFLLFRAGAATSNFEAESGARNSLATVGSDSAASGGKFTAFATPTTSTTNSVQRFPGDPNPLVTGKSYWGSSFEGGKDPYERHEAPTGKPLPLRRTFFGWSGRTTSMVTGAATDLSKGRLPWVSIKPPSWAEMASGKRDAEIDEMLVALDNIGGPDKPVWFTVHHEPEGGGGSINGGPDDTAGAAGWRGMQSRVRARINALKAQGKPMDNIAFAPILMGYTFDAGSNRNPEDWWVDGIWDFYGIDVYCYESCSSRGRTIVTTPPLAASVKFVQSKKIPMGIGEWGETNNATVWAQAMREFWEYGFKNKVDLVGYSAFDSGLNPPEGTTVDTTMPKEVLSVFHDILKNDQRVQRVADLGKSSSTSTSTSTYGTVTAKASVPKSGTYNVWVRMNVPNTTNNAVQLQVDGGTATKVGDGSITPNTWTWVNWKNGDINNKTTMALTQGDRTFKLTGIEANVKVDRVLVTEENCIPTGTGDNCAVIVVDPPEPDPGTGTLNVNITSPLSNQTVKGVTKVTAAPADNIQEVSFRINGVWQAIDDTAPFEWNWDTTKTANGNATVTIRARKIGDPGTVYTQKDITVKVSNGTTTVTPPPADTIAPTKPTNLSAALRFDAAKFKYVFDLKWTAATDNVGVTQYAVSRDGTALSQLTATSYTDSSALEGGRSYKYTVAAKDAMGNTSPAASITVKGSCFLVWCNMEVL